MKLIFKCPIEFLLSAHFKIKKSISPDVYASSLFSTRNKIERTLYNLRNNIRDHWCFIYKEKT